MKTTLRSTVIMLAGFAFAGVAVAAGYDVNGIRLGMTQAEVQAAAGDRIECAERPPSDTDPSQVTCVNAQFARSKTLADTFAGQKTVIRYHLLDGHVARISFLGLPSMAFDHIVATMEASYGKATVANQDVRVGIKSELVDKRATWRNDAGDAIVFDKYTAGNLERAHLNFYSRAYPQNLRPDPVD